MVKAHGARMAQEWRKNGGNNGRKKIAARIPQHRPRLTPSDAGR
jgi:hypothetical protein